MNKSALTGFQRSGLYKTAQPLTARQIETLTNEYQKATEFNQTLHYNQLAGLHNPWGKSAHLFDSWALFDICQSEAILNLIRPLIGPDIILWESAFYGHSALPPHNTWLRHSDLSPINNAQGVVVRIAIKPTGLELDYLPGSHHTENINEIKSAAKSITIKAGDILCHDARLAHRYTTAPSNLLCDEYVIQYMPATSQFVRDPASTIQQHLTENLPLINYARSPIWLVAGQDHSGNDFVSGFSPPVGQWTNAQW